METFHLKKKKQCNYWMHTFMGVSMTLLELKISLHRLMVDCKMFLTILLLIYTSSCGVQGAFEFPAIVGDPVTMDCPYRAVQWYITTNNNTRVVAICTNLNCTNYEPNEYLASFHQAGVNSISSASLLLVKSVRRPGLAAECKVNSTFTAYAWQLNAIVKPTVPQCSIPLPHADGETVSVQCQTVIYPKANCIIYVQGQYNVTTNSATYNHTWSPISNLTITTCLLSFYIKDAVWNSSALFRVGVYPSMNLGNSFTTYNNWSLIFVQSTDAPKVIAVTANSQNGFLVVSPNTLVTIRCIAVGSAGSPFSIYNLTTYARLLNSTTIPNTLEYVMRDVMKSSSVIGCQPGNDVSSRKMIRVYVGPDNSPVSHFTANSKSTELSVSQGSDVLLNCSGDDIPGHKLVLTYHFTSGVNTVMDEAELPANILHVFHNVPCGNLTYFSCRVDDRVNTERIINISVECLKETCCASEFPIIPVSAGVASGIGLILLIIIIFCVCRRCRHKKSESAAAENVNHYDSAKNLSRINRADQNYNDQKSDYARALKNETLSSDVKDKGGVDVDALSHSDYSAYSTNIYNMERNTPKRMSILRSSARKKLAASLYSETFSNDPNQNSRNNDIYHINKGYVSDSDASQNHYASSSISSTMVPPSYESSASSSKEYAVPYSVRNRDVRPQKPSRDNSKQVYKPPYRTEYDEPYGHGYSTEV